MITKAIIPVAGWGTRRLPITKAIEKCMLPIGNVPVIDFVVQDCLKAGITDFYFVVSDSDSQLERYYSSLPELERYLQESGKEAAIPLVTPPAANFHFVVQEQGGKYGTTVPVWLCREYVQPGEQILVIMGDQFFYRMDGGSNAAELIELTRSKGLRNGLLGVPVPREEVHKYGMIEKDENDNYIRIVEKPSPETAPSNLNNASFYLFDHELFDYFDRSINIAQTDEYGIIDPINEFVARSNKVAVGEAKGEYLDAGSVEGWLYANNVVVGNVS